MKKRCFLATGLLACTLGATALAAAPAPALDETVYSRYDFVPGSQVIFYDDFSDTDVGEFPVKWHLKGPREGRNNAVEVVEYQGKRWMRSRPAREDDQSSSTQYLRLKTAGDLPPKFTLEFDAVLGWSKYEDSSARYFVYLLKPDADWPGTDSPRTGMLAFHGQEGRSANTQTAIAKLDNKPHHIAISVNGSFVKAWVDHERVINDPDGIERPIALLGLGMVSAGGTSSERVMITNVRLAAGGKDIKAALETDGRIVTHGILFDTGSDRLKGESLPTLKMILGLLQADPQLRFAVEGHTDDQGGKAVNQPLSERRAASVRAWLLAKGIAAERLRASGHGDSRPIDKNSSAEGRANNRRVEFVKF